MSSRKTLVAMVVVSWSGALASCAAATTETVETETKSLAAAALNAQAPANQCADNCAAHTCSKESAACVNDPACLVVTQLMQFCVSRCRDKTCTSRCENTFARTNRLYVAAFNCVAECAGKCTEGIIEI